MREIIFRGKRIDNGEWVYGYYYTHIGCLSGVKIEGHFIKCGDEDHKVDPTTIGQFSGLYDKNGDRVFDGDIIKVTMHNGLYSDEWIEEVVFESGQFGIKHGDLHQKLYPLSTLYKPTRTEYISNYGEVATESVPVFEVIGNKYEGVF